MSFELSRNDPSDHGSCWKNFGWVQTLSRGCKYSRKRVLSSESTSGFFDGCLGLIFETRSIWYQKIWFHDSQCQHQSWWELVNVKPWNKAECSSERRPGDVFALSEGLCCCQDQMWVRQEINNVCRWLAVLGWKGVKAVDWKGVASELTCLGPISAMTESNL